MGIFVENIQLLGRWICGVVLRYTRAAPLKTIADDMKRNAASTSNTKAITDMSEITSNLKTAMDAIMIDYAARFLELKDAIKVAEDLARPRTFVANRKSGKVRKILTRVEDIGSEAMTYCSFKYAKAPVNISKELPDVKREMYCSTCLGEVRAAMKKS